MVKPPRTTSRRNLLISGGAFIGSTGLALGSGAYRFQIGHDIVARPSRVAELRGHLTDLDGTCSDSAQTPWVSEGPFYAPSAPLRSDLRPTNHGVEELRLAGRVLDANCQPIAGAVLDFWQTDPGGLYDHFGYQFRGHQFTDEQGRYELLTLLPASYRIMGIARRRHIHMKVAATGHPLLTTQVFFPFGPDREVEDISFDRALVTNIVERDTPFIEARYDFVMGAL